MTDLEAIARGLSKADLECVARTDPDRLEGSTATLFNLALRGLADVRPDNTLLLTPDGLALRRHILAQEQQP